jgi:pantetheine-phosphate adenylyltransferase
MKIAVYPGSFDPITNGHIDILSRASKFFDKVYVTVLNNPDKKTLFTVDERIKIITEIIKDKDGVEIAMFDGLLVDYAKNIGADAIVRGLRAVSDFDYEFQLALTNRTLNDTVDTVFLMTNKDYSYLSSGLVKQICQFGGDVSEFVPEIVMNALKEKYASPGGIKA